MMLLCVRDCSVWLKFICSVLCVWLVIFVLRWLGRCLFWFRCWGCWSVYWLMCVGVLSRFGRYNGCCRC